MTASFADQEIWHVMIARDDLKRMNVDQLDDAFRLDIVDASTLVWKNGMDQWRRLGSIAGIDDEPETIARVPARPLGPPAAPPPPRPPRPQHQAHSLAPAVNPFAATVNPFAATAHYASNAPAAVFAAPLVAPVAPQQLFAPDPYTLPKRRAKVASEIDFRRRSGGVRWGRWLFAFALLTTGVLAAYRQNYLREGARRVGLENKYLYGEKRAVGWVTAKTPGALQAALRQLKLLPPGAAAAALTPSVAAAAPVTPVAAAPEPANANAPSTLSPSDPSTSNPSPSSPSPSDPGLKTVSLDSLPVLGVEPAPAVAPAAPAAATKARAATRTEPASKVASKPRKPTPEAKTKAKPKAKAAAEAAPKPAKAEAAPKPAKAPPPTMSSPLKAAIWQAMQEDAKKGK